MITYMKYLYNCYQIVDAIKKLFIEKNRCQWIIKKTYSFENKEAKFFLPSKLLPSTHQIFYFIKIL